MYCGNCGHNNKEGLNYCTNCGASLQEQQAPQVPSPVVMKPTITETTIEKPGFRTTFHEVDQSKAQPQRYSGFAVAALVLAIVAAVTSFIPIINNASFFIAIIGFIFGLIGVYATSKKRKKGNAMAVVGTLLCVASVAIVLVTQNYYGQQFREMVEDFQFGAKPVSTTANNDASNPTKISNRTEYGDMSQNDSVTLDNGLTVKLKSYYRDETTYNGKEGTGVLVEYVNNGNANVSFNEFDWKAANKKGAIKNPTMYTGARTQLTSGQLAPGGSVEGVVFFEGHMKKLYYYSSLLNSDSEISWFLKG